MNNKHHNHNNHHNHHNHLINLLEESKICRMKLSDKDYLKHMIPHHQVAVDISYILQKKNILIGREDLNKTNDIISIVNQKVDKTIFND